MTHSKPSPTVVAFDAKPYYFHFPLTNTALLVIDMQRDFIYADGFGEIQGGNLEAVQASIAPTRALLEACRNAGLHIFHTREGQAPDLSDCPSSKLLRQAAAPGNTQHMKVIGDDGKMGRLLVRGQHGQDFVDELQPLPNEVIIDKPGKGSFWNTPIMHKLKQRSITHLLVSGVTTECCFSTSIREANDRGFECCGIIEATAGYNQDFKTASLDMIKWSQGLFGFIGQLQPLLEALKPLASSKTSLLVSTPPHTPPVWDGSLDISNLQKAYRAGLSPVTVVEALYDKIERYKTVDSALWIHLMSRKDVLSAAWKLSEAFPDKACLPPLFGVPFSVKDSINIAGLPTTMACPPLAYTPSQSAKVYDLVIAQGAICLGKVNLDQLATGLNGCRSPYGVTHSIFDDKHISGGSSSGSAVSVGAGLASFSLATDTAGSGRIPAAFNGMVGFKPTRGLISFEGITPACLSLDCCAIMATTVADARLIWQLCEQYDENDRYARDAYPAERHVDSLGPKATSFKFGVPPAELLQLCSPIYRQKFNDTVRNLQACGGILMPVDWTPFQGAGDLLYDGTFVSERLASLPDDFLSKNAQHLHPVILELFENVVARQSTAVQVYRDMQTKALFTRQATAQFTSSDRAGVDVVVVPTAPEHPLIADMLADPIKLNAKLGTFTHCGNVLDLCAVATPAGTYELADSTVLPFGVTFLGARCSDSEVLNIAARFSDSLERSH